MLRVNTHVVLIDALVRDKKTGAAVRDLPADSFRVFADGRPRALTYFSREGVRRRPLALVLVLDLNTGGILYLERPEVMEQIISALSKLPPEDEIAVAQVWYEPQAERLSFRLRSKTVEGLTRDRARTFAALRGAQQFARENLPRVKFLFSLKETYKATWKDAILAGLKTAGGVAPIEPPFKITVAPDFEYQLDKAPPLAARERPDSSVFVLEVTDDFGAEPFGESSARARRLVASGVTVAGLVIEKNLTGRAVDLTGRIISPLVGARFHTVAYYGRETGGEVATVGRPEEFAAAVERIVAGLAGRYSLGFTLGDEERDDGHMHRLEVKVAARDARGHERKLTVSARRGFYLPKGDETRSVRK